MELVRQPVFLLLMTCAAVFNVFLAAVPYFGFGDDPKLVKDSTLAVMLLSGLFGAVLNASASVAHEIRSGTALAVLAKPVGRAQFLLAKYLGLAAAILILFALLVLAGLALACSTRFEMIPTLAICTGIFLLGLMSDYLFGRRAEPVWMTNLQAELNNPQLTGEQKTLLQELVEKYDRNKDGRLDLPEQNTLSTQDRQRLTRAGLGGRWWASVLYTIVPNWQLFWLADALEGKNRIPWSYVGRA